MQNVIQGQDKICIKAVIYVPTDATELARIVLNRRTKNAITFLNVKRNNTKQKMTRALGEINLHREVKSFDTLVDKHCGEKKQSQFFYTFKSDNLRGD